MSLLPSPPDPTDKDVRTWRNRLAKKKGIKKKKKEFKHRRYMIIKHQFDKDVFLVDGDRGNEQKRVCRVTCVK